MWGASKPNSGLLVLMEQQEEAAKYPSQLATALEILLTILSLCSANTGAFCLCQVHVHRQGGEMSGSSTEFQARWDVCHLIRKSPWYSSAWPSPFTSPFQKVQVSPCFSLYFSLSKGSLEDFCHLLLTDSSTQLPWI